MEMVWGWVSSVINMASLGLNMERSGRKVRNLHYLPHGIMYFRNNNLFFAWEVSGGI